MINRRSVLKSLALSAFGGLQFTNLSFALPQREVMPGKESKIFDPADGFAPLTDPLSITDCTIARRGNRWWMYMGGCIWVGG
jgi:hypothetical protein